MAVRKVGKAAAFPCSLHMVMSGGLSRALAGIRAQSIRTCVLLHDRKFLQSRTVWRIYSHDSGCSHSFCHKIPHVFQLFLHPQFRHKYRCRYPEQTSLSPYGMAAVPLFAVGRICGDFRTVSACPACYHEQGRVARICGGIAGCHLPGDRTVRNSRKAQGCNIVCRIRDDSAICRNIHDEKRLCHRQDTYLEHGAQGCL